MQTLRPPMKNKKSHHKTNQNNRFTREVSQDGGANQKNTKKRFNQMETLRTPTKKDTRNGQYQCQQPVFGRRLGPFWPFSSRGVAKNTWVAWRPKKKRVATAKMAPRLGETLC